MRRRHFMPCAEIGCPEVTDQVYCEPHRIARQRQAEKRRPTSEQRGYGRKWQRTSRAYLAAHPICECSPECTAPSTDVDHIDGLGPNGPRGYDWSNLRAMAHGHHSKRTARDTPGGWAAH